jgi:hypothetical protein
VEELGRSSVKLEGMQTRIGRVEEEEDVGRRGLVWRAWE